MKLTNEDKAILVGSGVSMFVASTIYICTLRKERKKRKKIHEWELMYQKSSEEVKKRIKEVMNDPNATGADVRKIIAEDSEILINLANQFKY